MFRRATFDEAAAAIGLPGLHPHELLGHASAAMTLDRYGHLFGDRLDQVADAMDAARAAVVYPMCTRAEIGADEQPAGNEKKPG